jgi:hypothetical protein
MTPETNSYTFLIRDEMIARIKGLGFFKNVARWGRTKMKAVQEPHLPYFGCYFIQEDLRGDGDINAGEPRFYHEAKYGFSYMIKHIDDEIAENQLDSAYWALMNGLLTPQQWQRFSNDVQIEGVLRVKRLNVFGNSALNNETPVAELQVEYTVTYRSAFEPVVEDVLEKVHVTVAYPWPYDPNAEEPFIAEYDLPTQ